LVAYRFVASAADPRERLDKFIVELLARSGTPSSRAAVQRWIRAGRVTLGGRPALPSETVPVGAIVALTPAPPEPSNLEPDPSVPFDVLYEDEHLMIVDKPGGVVMHPARGHESKTLVHGLLARGSFTIDEGSEQRVRPGIVHRLDKGTSGILVVAKDERTREGLKAQFMRHDIERAYLAIVVGNAETRLYETLHGRSSADRVKFTSRVARGKRAVTRVRVLERLAGGKATVVACRLETGRTHQIRVHLSECGHTPILGDPIYGRTPGDPWLRAVAERLGRQALHAFVLGFVHPVTGKSLHFEREPPSDFKFALQALREGAPRHPA